MIICKDHREEGNEPECPYCRITALEAKAQAVVDTHGVRGYSYELLHKQNIDDLRAALLEVQESGPTHAERQDGYV